MLKILAFLAVLLALAFGFAQLADTPGHVIVQFGETELRVTLVIALVALLALVAASMILWGLFRFVFRLPSLISISNRVRKREKGQLAVARGLVAVGVGDQRQAARQAALTDKLLGKEPLALLLRAQTAQLGGDEKGAELAFKAMLDNPDTHGLGLRGLYVEASRKGDADGARLLADQAYRVTPGASWASDAMLRQRALEKNWRGAIGIVEQGVSRRIIERNEGKHLRASLLTAAALDARDSNPEEAMALGLDALRLKPDLVPAAELVARRYTAKSDFSKASKVLETAWKTSPHPDLAEAYTTVRHGDSAIDRLKRARTLEKLNPSARESRFAVARAALDAREFVDARAALDSLVLQKATARACLLMAELEELESNNQGLVRSWLARASRAPRDPAWIMDGTVSDHWSPASPVTGLIGAAVWEEPPQASDVSIRARIDADRFEVIPELPALVTPVQDGQGEPAPSVAADNSAQASEVSQSLSDRPMEEAIRPFVPDDPGPDLENKPAKRRFGIFG
ncbi:COG3898 Uncharacterized membrane-bound protein [Rhabdaerophilaceae bacterium]